MSKYICQWCGSSSDDLDDFEYDEVNKNGFWCPDCDGHTYLDEEKNDRRRMLLLLESKCKREPKSKSTRRKLNKRLSPLRYPGGKSKLIDFLAAQFHDEQLNAFVEAFAGGAAVGLSLLDGGYIQKLVLNDLDPGIYALWNTIVTDPSQLLLRLDGPLPTRETYRQNKSVLTAPGCATEDELAWAELVCNRLSYSGIIKANALGGKNGTQSELLVRWNPPQLKKRILKIHSMRDRITVSCIDARQLIQEYAYWDDCATLFIDPPYFSKGKALYQKFYTEQDHRDLAFLLESLFQGMPGADIVITYDDCKLVRELYPYADIKEISRYYSA